MHFTGSFLTQARGPWGSSLYRHESSGYRKLEKMTTQISLVLEASVLNQHLCLQVSLVEWSHWLHLIVCVCPCACLHMYHVCVYMERAEGNPVVPQMLFTLFFKTGTLTGLELAEWGRLDGPETILLSSPGVLSIHHAKPFHTGSGDLTQGFTLILTAVSSQSLGEKLLVSTVSLCTQTEKAETFGEQHYSTLTKTH